MSRLSTSVLGTLSVAALVGVAGCAPAPSPSAPQQTTATPLEVHGPPAAPPPTEAPAPPVEEPPLPLRTAPFSAERLHPHVVTSIAVGKPPKLATFGSEPHLFDSHGWRMRPIPALDDGTTIAHATIYYGRDNQPRLMGAVRRGDGFEPLYLRHVPAGFREEPSEIANLATTPGGLYGVLGYEDPEVVCAPRSICLVKSLRGWKRMPAHVDFETLFMTTTGVHVVRAGQLLVLEDTTWKAVADVPLAAATTTALKAPAPDTNAQVTGFCVETPKRAWLVGGGAVYLRDVDVGPTFVRDATLTKGAHTVLCERPGSVWVVGDGGAAHFDGTTWLALDADLGALVSVAKGHGAVLVGGAQGLFALRARPEASSK